METVMLTSFNTYPGTIYPSSHQICVDPFDSLSVSLPAVGALLLTWSQGRRTCDVYVQDCHSTSGFYATATKVLGIVIRLRATAILPRSLEICLYL
jgi:hypothetical protein